LISGEVLSGFLAKEAETETVDLKRVSIDYGVLNWFQWTSPAVSGPCRFRAAITR
jgi:hypothetical protein